jgi:PAS domain S-box-containing protein
VVPPDFGALMSSQALPSHAKHLFRYLFEHASLGIAVVDLEGRLLLANPALCFILGYGENELCGMSCSELTNAEDCRDDWALFQQLRSGVIEQYSMEKRYLRKDGTQGWGRLNVSLSKDGDEGSSPLIFAFLEEITEYKQTEAALRESEQRLRLAVRAGRMYAFDWDPRTDMIVRSEECRDILNWMDDPEHETGRNFSDRVHPDDREVYSAAEAGLTPEHPAYQTSYRMLRPDGSVIWLEDTGRAFFNTPGKIVRVTGMVADVTARKRVEEALREGEARERARTKELEAILDAVPVPVLIAYDTECRQMKGNRAAHEQLRVREGQNFSQSAEPDERPAFRQMQDGVEIPTNLLPMQQAAATGKPEYRRLLTAVFPDGTRREELANAVPLLDEAGQPRGAIGTSIDLTELRRTEEALRESEDKLRLLLDSTAEAIYGIDLEHRCMFCNPACLRALGYERVEELLGKNMHDLMHHTRLDGTRFPVEECRVHRVVQTGKGEHSEDEVLWKANGTSFPVEYWSYPQWRGHEVVGAVVAFNDITARKLAEAALANVSRKLIEAQEQERARIGRELHDDIGQRLALLAAQLQQLQENPLIVPEVRSRMGELEKQISEIASDIQLLSHELHLAKLRYLGIAGAVRGFCREFSVQQKVDIDFQTDALPALSPDVSLCLFRVLQEALHNSAKHSGVRHFEVRLWRNVDEIHLTVKDSGVGFDREQAKMSQGLGLVSMEERLKLVNGTLTIETQPEGGATIHARVPVESDSVRPAG